MSRLWLLFSQAVTIAVAALFVVWTFHPEWLRRPLTPAASLPTIREAAPAAGEPVVPAGEAGGPAAAARASPAVVSIYTTREVTRSSPLRNHPLFGPLFDGEPQTEEQPGLGSGVIVSQNGYILTNNHVVEAADAIEVALADGRTAPAQVVGVDPDTDLAVLRINLSGLPAITFADPSQARVGAPVLFNHVAVAQVRVDDLIDIVLIDEGIPDGLRVDHADGTFVAAIEATGLIDPHLARAGQAQRLDPRFGMLPHRLGTAVGTTSTTVVASIEAKKDVALEVAHRTRRVRSDP